MYILLFSGLFSKETLHASRCCNRNWITKLGDIHVGWELWNLSSDPFGDLSLARMAGVRQFLG